MEKNVFEQLSVKYDTEARKEVANVVVKRVSEELQNSHSKTLIDYGSGTGLVSLELADFVDSVLLVDAAEQMLEVAEMKIKQRGIENAETLYADFTTNLPNIKADIIFMSLVLLHIPDTKRILKILYSILNKGGKLLIVDFDKNEKVTHPKVHNGFVHTELKELLTEIGFHSTAIETFHDVKEFFVKQDASMFILSSVK